MNKQFSDYVKSREGEAILAECEKVEGEMPEFARLCYAHWNGQKLAIANTITRNHQPFGESR